ncbi:MAG TPA: MFS transporter [Alphaproteobacteria bacterium]|nr:MFS transporter [Alphaproteobacteria bacterium]
MSQTLDTASAPGPRSAFGPLVIIIASGVMMTLAMGIRQTFGLFLDPLSYANGLPITVWALAMALQNIVWGLGQPIAGAVVDRYGTPVVAVFGIVLYAAGLFVTALVPSGTAVILAMGVLVGIGLACTGFGTALAAVGRAASPAQRSKALGLSGAIGGLGQVALPPVTQALIGNQGPAFAFLVLAAVMLLSVPFGFAIRDGAAAPRANEAAPRGPRPSPLQIIRAAMSDRGYFLLTVGFFTCGFQLAFITTYLPGYLLTCHLPAGLGAVALSLIGLFNMAGSWLCGHAGTRWRPQHVLGWLYLVRAAVLFGFLVLPKSDITVFAFAAIMGLTWLGTAPLTNGVIGRLFGVRDLGTLFGGCFLSHQVGSFLGAWLGGVAFDLTGSYDIVWVLTAVAGVFAAVVNFPIRDRPGLQPA